MQMRTHLVEEDESTISLNGQGAQAWLGAFNDIRLALGVRLNIADNSYERFELLSPEDPMAAVFAVYSWLGWLQQSLISNLMDDVREDDE
jgi:hypothetical protein